MARTTRSGVQWSPWEFDCLAQPTSVDAFQSAVDLAPHLAQALASAELRAVASEKRVDAEDGEWEDEVAVVSRAASPVPHPPSPTPPGPSTRRSPRSPSRSPSRPASRPPSPLSEPPSSPEPPFVAAPSLAPTHRGRKKLHQSAGKKARRARHRQTRAQASLFGPSPQAKHYESRVEDPSHTVPADASPLPASAGGAWIGPDPKKPRLSHQQPRRLQALLAEGYDLVEWDGRYVKLTQLQQLQLKSSATVDARNSFWILRAESLRYCWVALMEMIGTWWLLSSLE